ncbi:hypothetical protein M0D69_09660 [Caballeronia sp. SEWSISQ10-4 2]|uniref:hypothetical protein n=1 Tax=Caballeronia sp. SEWSISQ10-4 2 TaxID=2937438 RepID=UPI00264BEBC7|nr:hypothetical protein [Caballeronia sp. SEWSISQ10-4 2]MDN7178281.1 hypothetical protein [Caballeronia sp. SEWSISQ10-4 2]
MEQIEPALFATLKQDVAILRSTRAFYRRGCSSQLYCHELVVFGRKRGVTIDDAVEDNDRAIESIAQLPNAAQFPFDWLRVSLPQPALLILNCFGQPHVRLPGNKVDNFADRADQP